MIKALFVIVMSGITGSCLANDADSSKNQNRHRLLAVPTFGASPETKAYAGIVCLVTRKTGPDTNARINSMKAEFTYTQRRQIIGALGWLAFYNQGKTMSAGKLQRMRYPDYFWGTGNSTPNEARTTFNSSRWNSEAAFLFRISKKKSVYVGPALRYIEYSNIARLEGDSSTFAQLKNARRISPIGVSAILDQRNNPLNATKGKYVSLLSHFMTGNANQYFRHTADFRAYHTVKKTVLAGRFKAALSGGDVMDAVLFGGDETTRGYYLGRYIVGYYATAQAEMRRFFLKRWGLAVFGGSSLLGYDIAHRDRIVGNYGAGLRFLIDRKSNINMRFDYAHGSSGNSGFYVAFGESF